MLTFYKTDDIKEIKLMALFIIDRFGKKATRSFLTDTFLTLGVANYFDILHCLSELKSDAWIEISASGEQSIFSITEKGSEILSFFEYKIPFSVREKIIGIIEAVFWQDKHSSRIVADFTPESESEFKIECEIIEDNSSLFRLEFSAPSREAAKEICKNFKKNAQKIYLDIVNAVVPQTKNEEDKDGKEE